jgi:hypothetical protein
MVPTIGCVVAFAQTRATDFHGKGTDFHGSGQGKPVTMEGQREGRRIFMRRVVFRQSARNR